MNFQNFSVSEGLKNQLTAMEKSRRMPHAIIISSPDPKKREELTMLLSMWAVCSHDEDAPCSQCSQCLKAKGKHHSDIYYAKGKGKTDGIPVMEIRNIVRDSVIIPSEAKRKVYILTDADKRMGKESLNAFLKTLEEPSQDTLFLLTAENTKVLPVTILSRCTILQTDTERSLPEEEMEIAREILRGLVELREMPLMIATSKLSQRNTALGVLPLVRGVLSDALSLSVGAETLFDPECASQLRRKLTKDKLIKLIDITTDAINKVNRNVNPTLLTTWLCGEYRRISWQK